MLNICQISVFLWAVCQQSHSTQGTKLAQEESGAPAPRAVSRVRQSAGCVSTGTRHRELQTILTKLILTK